MNPYKYSDPLPTERLLESSTKLKTKSYIVNSIPSNRRSRKYVYLMFVLGIVIGISITTIIKSYFIKSNICLNKGHTIIQKPSGLESFNSQSSKKNLIYIGVMTANKYLDTRAKAIYETWGKYVPGDIAFFSSEMSETEANIPLIKLKGVDDSYPPQKKSFMMIKYMYDNYINDYEYFMRADDDIYIRTDRLEKFLKSINSSNLYYIGQAGRGNQDEFGHLSLNNQENFCMGGPGMIFSKPTLEKMAPFIKNCVKNLRSTHEDVEVGRCIQKFAGIPCTWSYEMQQIFYHNNSDSKAFTGSLNYKEVHRAITLHPIKNHFHLYRLHAYIKSLMIKDREFEVVQAMREMKKLCTETKSLMPNLDNARKGIFIKNLGVDASLQKWKASKEGESLDWDFLHKNAYQLKDINPKHRMTSFVNASVSDVIRDIMETINRLSKERGRIIDFKETLYGYRRHNPSYSSEYILDLLLVFKKYRGKKMTVPVRRHAYIQVPFGPLYARESENSEEETSSFNDSRDKNGGSITSLAKNLLRKGLDKFSSLAQRTNDGSKELKASVKKIVFILPLAGRLSTFERFLNDFRRVCLDNSENVELIIVLFRPRLGDRDSRRDVEGLVRSTKTQYPSVPISLVKTNSTFARAGALELGAAQCQFDDLLFFVDVDMTFTSQTLENIRSQTILGKQVYYPIVFSEFDPDVLVDRKSGSHDHLSIDNEVGYWRYFGFGIVAMYKADLRRVGGLDTNILGWGKEDVDLFEKVIKDRGLLVFRTADPGLVHIYHNVECDPTIDSNQLKMCRGSQFSTYASLRTLAKIILKKPEIITFKRTLA